VSLYQCERCGCCENTALGHYWAAGHIDHLFDWTGIEDRKGLKLCSACMPTHYRDGKPLEAKGGGWHGQFPRVFLPKGKFRTSKVGNLEHIETGSENFRQFALEGEEQ
jgi:hypothetical protein